MKQQESNFLKLLSAILCDSEVTLENPRYDEILNIAHRQNLYALVGDYLVNKKIITNDAQTLFEILRVIGDQQIRTDSFLKLYSQFKKVKPIVIKGIICRQLYGSKSEHRPSGDEDLLISISEFDYVDEIMSQNGFRPKTNHNANDLHYVQAISYSNEDDLTIELHINPFGTYSSLEKRMNAVFESCFEHTMEENIGSVSLRTLSCTDHFLFLVFHAFKHFLFSGFGIRMVCDILLYLKKYSAQIDEIYLNEVMKSMNIYKFYKDVLYIGNRYLGFEFQGDCFAAEELLEDVFDAGIFGNESEDRIIAAVITRAALKGKNKKIHNFKYVVFPGANWAQKLNPDVRNKPWMIIPLYWKRIKRGCSVIVKNNQSGIEGLKLSEKRIKLIKKYDLL